MSSLSLELTDFINPELTWKKEAKGSRNTSRRARKVIDVSLLLGAEFSKQNSRIVEEASVSDSEKFGVDVLGRRFGDKVEHIPIKKRKLFRSSASPTGGSSPRVSNARRDKKSSSSQKSVTKSVAKFRTRALKFGRGVSEGKMDVSRKKIFENEDFSGIDFLATVACGDSVDDFCRADMDPVVEDLSAREGIGSSGSTGTSTGTTHVLSEAPVCEDHMEGSLSDDNSVAVLHSSSSPIKDEGRDKSHESKDGRFHWDLNVVMDAWDQPCDDKTINSQTKVSEDFSCSDMPNRKLEEASQGCVILKCIKENKSDAESTAQSTVGKHTSGDILPDSVSAICKSSEEQSSILALTNSAPNPQYVLVSTTNGSDANASGQSPSMVVSLYKPIQNNATSFLVPDKSISQGTDGLTSELEKVDCLTVTELVEANCAKSSLSKQSDLAHLHKPVAEEISSKTAENIVSEGGELLEKMSGLYDVGESWGSPDEMSNVTCQPPVKNSVSSTSPLFKEASESSIFVGEDKHRMSPNSGTDKPTLSEDIAKVDGSEGLINMSLRLCNTVCDDNTENKFQQQCRNYATIAGSQSGKVVLQDCSCRINQDSDVLQDNQVPMVGTASGTRSQEDYDSQYEDGELRESDICEGNDIKDLEAEGADIYDGARYYTDAAEYPASISGRDEGEADSGKLLSSKRHLSKPTAVFTTFSGEEAGRSTSVERGKCTSSEIKRSVVDQLQTSCRRSPGLTEKVIEGKADVRGSRRELLPRTEMAGSIDRKGYMLSQRSRSQKFDESYQSEISVGFNKSMGRDKSDVHPLGRNQAGNHWVDHSVDDWDSKPHNSFDDYGPYDSSYPAPRNVMANSKGIYRRVIRRSPDDRDDAFMMRSSCLRGRSGRYSQGAGRGYRGSRNGYNGSMPDYPSESFRISQRFSKRDRSFSPVPGRVAISHPRISPSRSRTRSPPPWLLQQEQSTGLRDHSRSPDFRAEVRMERVRIPFRQSNFTQNYERRFASPPRNRFSPQQSSRWVDKKTSGMDYLGDRRSPVRGFRQNQRFNVTNAPEKVKSDEYFRPMLRSGRFPEVAPSDRARRYEGSDDDRRKYGDRYDAVRPMRQYEKDVFPRHFGHDTEDCLVGRNTLDNDDFVRVTDRRYRDMPRKSREEKGPARFDNDRMTYSCPKSIEMRSMRRMHL